MHKSQARVEKGAPSEHTKARPEWRKMLLVSTQKPGQVEKDATSERTKARSWWRSVLLVSAQKPGQRAADWG